MILDFQKCLQCCNFNRLNTNAALKVQKKISISTLPMNCLVYFVVLDTVTELTIQNDLAVKSRFSWLNLNACCEPRNLNI